jgi:DNA polymerase-1
MPLVRVLADMEARGVRIDRPYLEEVKARFESEIARLEGEIHEIAGGAFNINSSKQLAFLLFEKFGLPVVRKTKTGFSTDEEVLKKLSPLHPLPAKIVEYRELAKLKSTYIDALLAGAASATNRVHTSLNQAVAATGRLSSTDPNLQNIPIRTEYGRMIRKAFVAEPGWTFLSADYSQIDLRVLAHISKDPVLSDAFRRGDDIHAATAREIFNVPPNAAVNADQRRVAKTVNFGIVYGQTAFGLSQQLGIGLPEARRYIDKYFERYSGVKAWMEGVILEAKKEGKVTTLLNRVRYLPEINSPNAAVRAFAERTAMNTPIQGTSADIIKLAMRDVDMRLREKGLKTRLLLQVHDELLFELPPEERAVVPPLVRRAMEDALRLDVPIVADLKYGVNWLEMEKRP